MRILAVFVSLMVLAGGAAAREVATDPVLRIETGAHGADIPGLTVTPDGRQIVSASLDKTLRIWTPGDRNEAPRKKRKVEGE